MDSPEVFAHLKSPFVMIIFGATGDLSHSKLIPGLLSLYNKKMLPKEFFIVGYSRRDYDDQEFRDSFENEKDPPRLAGARRREAGKVGWEEFSKHLHYLQGTFE